MSLTERKAGSGAVDPDDFNALVDAVAVLQAGGGGGSQPASDQWAEYNGGIVTIAGGGNAHLTLTSLGAGVDLLDLSDTENPAIITEGRYAVTANVNATALADGIYYDATLHLDAEDQDAVSHHTSSPGDGESTIWLSLSCTFFVPAGGVVRVTVNNGDSSPRDFKWDEAIVTRLS